MTLVALVSALDDEQQGFLAQLHNPTQVTRAGRRFWLGQLWGQPVVLALSNIGKVAAATTATALIEHFGASQVVFSGVAGGVAPGVDVGDVVVADAFVQHDMDASPLFARYQVPLYPSATFRCDAKWTASLHQAALAAIKGQSRGRVHTGLVASGDQFLNSAAAVSRLLADTQAVGLCPLAVEMEGAAVAQVCHDYGVPFAAFRTISDRADDSSHLDFSSFVTTTAGPLALAVFQQLFTSTSPAS